jgi:hypothetical protein
MWKTLQKLLSINIFQAMIKENPEAVKSIPIFKMAKLFLKLVAIVDLSVITIQIICFSYYTECELTVPYDLSEF